MNKVRSTLVNEYTVGGSLLLVGFGFFSTRFADVLSYQVATIPSMIPVIGGASVTVGRVLGIVPATLGLAVLFRKARDVPMVSEATELPLVKTIVNYVEDLNEDITSQIEIVPGQSGKFPLPLDAEEMAAEQLLLCSEHDDYFSACGCGSKVSPAEEPEGSMNRLSKEEQIAFLKQIIEDNKGKVQKPYELTPGGSAGFGLNGKAVSAEVYLKHLQVPKKKTTGSPKQQAWRSCVADAKGDMAKAKQLYSAMGY